jgi:hypothetical protein
MSEETSQALSLPLWCQHWEYHKRVESIEEIPKLKLDIGCGDSIQKSILKVLFNSEISYLQEFQYGKDVLEFYTPY